MTEKEKYLKGLEKRIADGLKSTRITSSEITKDSAWNRIISELAESRPKPIQKPSWNTQDVWLGAEGGDV